jgi:ADP-L-glycero-D-manno-heptose 6-epimerase
VIVVTGGAGFIGSALVWGLNKRGETNILVVDNLDTGDKWKNLAGLKFTDYMEKEDFLDAVLEGIFDAKTRAILHMGACSSTTETDASFLVRNNFEYTKHLANFATRRGIRFIYASSAATYGDGQKGYSDTVEDPTDFVPLNAYAFSKHLFDSWAYRKGLLGHITGLKYFNVFGPNEYHKGDMQSVVCKGYEEIKKTGKLRLFKSYKSEYADGEQARDFLYIKDAVAMTLHILDRPGAKGLYNIGSGAVRTWNELGAALFESMGNGKNIEYVEMPEYLKPKYQYYTKADMGKLRREGYDRPVTSLKDAVRDYVVEYLDKNARLVL